VESESLAILSILGAAKQDGPSRVWARAERLLDVDEIVIRSLAAYWSELSADQRLDARRLMHGFLRRVFVTQLGKFKGEQIQFQKESIRGERAVVTARLASTSGEISELVFLVRYSGAWRVYDVQVSGVSMLSNYRSQFHALWSRGGWEAVRGALEAKQ
jgi:phospholipid transport system substrate-binding protein